MKQIFRKQLWKRGLSYGLSIAMAAAILPADPVFAVESVKAEKAGGVLKAGTYPAGSATKTTGQPFAANTAGSENFRIPAMITLENGDIMASADARWETSGDWGGLDIIASVSSDGGNTWNYSFPFHFPDSKGYANYAAATFVDSALVQGLDGTVYCFADAQPADYSLQALSGKTDHDGTGYITIEGKKYLALTDNWDNCGKKPKDDDLETYAFYVGDFVPSAGSDEMYAPILKRADHQPTDYVVDEWYNIYEKNGSALEELTQPQIVDENGTTDSGSLVQQNVYYKDSRYHVYKTSYAWVISSKDNGRTWEHPRNISDQVLHETGEDAFLISPGRGLTTTKHGDIVLGDYYFNSGTDQVASMIYSTDNGKSWGRTNNVNKATSAYATENEIVELKDGRLLMFYRNSTGRICYTTIWRDVEDGEARYTISSDSVQTDIYIQQGATNCNLSAITYSKEIDGKQVILVSCPAGGVLAGGNERRNGRIFAFQVEENWRLTPIGTPFVVKDSSDAFQYSCLTELNDGTIGLLWENGSASMRYDRYSILDILPQADIKEAVVDVELNVGETYQREYVGTGEGAPEINQEITPGAPVADIESGIGTAVNATLYDHVNSNQAALANAFGENPNTGIRLSEMEYTFRKADGDKWQIYNESKRLYLTNLGFNGTHYFRNHPTSMVIQKVEGMEGLCFTNPDGAAPANDYRHFGFYLPGLNFNATGSVTHDDSGLQNLILFEKTNEASGGSLLNGYVQVDEPKDGGKYLITYVYTDSADDNAKRVIALYPVAGTSASQVTTKLIGKQPMTVEADASKKNVTITGVAEGERTAVVDGVIYRIHVTDPKLGEGGGSDREQKRLDLKVGESVVIQMEEDMEAVSSQSPAVKTELVNGFDITTEVKELPTSASGTSTKLTDMEFEFHSTGEGADKKWTIANKKGEKTYYLVNAHGGNYFSETPTGITVNEYFTGTNGKIGAYEIYNQQGSTKRRVIFWKGNSTFNRGNWDSMTSDANIRPVMLLEKNYVSGGNQTNELLGGYVPAKSLKEGGKYLIAYQESKNAEVYLLAVPNQNIDKDIFADMTRCVTNGTQAEKTENSEKYFTIEAKQNGYAAFSIGDVDYTVYVTDENTTFDDADRATLEAGGEYTIQFDSPTEIKAPKEAEHFDIAIDGTLTRDLRKLTGPSDPAEDSAEDFSEEMTSNPRAYLENAEYEFKAMSEPGPEGSAEAYYEIKVKKLNSPDAGEKYFGALAKNSSGNLNFFGQDSRMVKVEKVEEASKTYFTFSKEPAEGETEDTMCFHTTGDSEIPNVPMTFNLTSNYSGDDTKMTLFKKNPAAEGTPIPGYERADEIEEGETYLIAYEWSKAGGSEDGIFVLYPQNFIRNLVRLVGKTDLYKDTTSIVITPKTEDPVAEGIVINDKLYVIEVADHSGHNHISLGRKTARCDKNGYTGREKCLEENKIVTEGRTIAALGHQWDGGTVTTPIAKNENGMATADGVVTYTCGNKWDGLTHTRTVKIYAYAYNNLKEQCDLAAVELEKEGYAPEAKAKLQAAYDAKLQILTSAESRTADYYAAAEELEAAIAEAREDSGIVDVESITLDHSGTIRLVKGDSIRLTATVTPDNATDKEVTWTSSNANVAAVDQDGNVSGVAVSATRVTITASVGEGSSRKTATVYVRVVNPTVVPDPDCTCVVESLSVSPQAPEIVIPLDEEEGEVQLVPDSVIGGSCEIDGHPKAVVYSYKEKDIGTTDAKAANDGVITATAEGTAVITVSAQPSTSESKKEVDVTVTVRKQKNAEEEEKLQEKGMLQEAFNGVQTIYDGGEKDYYGADKWAEFKKAYEDVLDFLELPEEEQMQKTAEEIRNLKKALQDAQNALGKPSQPDDGNNNNPPGSGNGNNNPSGGNGTPPVQTGLTVGKEYQAGGIVFVAVTDQTITIKKGADKKTVKIPAVQKIDGKDYKVVGIESNAFKNCRKLKTVVIGSNVVTIKSKAFANCKALTAVTIGAGVKKIAKGAFVKCKKVKKVIFKGKSLPSMKGAFKNVPSNVVVKVNKNLRKNAAKKKKLANTTLKKAGLKVKTKNIK